ncbi:unnamed protein product [Rhodiola kirilowii]
MASQIFKCVMQRQATTSVLSTLSNSTALRAFSSDSDSDSGLIRATLFPGDGIGPEIAEAIK